MVKLTAAATNSIPRIIIFGIKFKEILIYCAFLSQEKCES